MNPPTNFSEAFFVAALWLAHPGVQDHLDGPGAQPLIANYKHTSYVPAVALGHEIASWHNSELHWEDFFTPANDLSSSSLAYYARQAQQCIGCPTLNVLRAHFGGKEGQDAASDAVLDRVKFVQRHVEHLNGLMEVSPGGGADGVVASLHYAPWRNEWQRRLSLWRHLGLALDRNQYVADRREHLWHLRRLLQNQLGEGEGELAFHRLDLPTISAWYDGQGPFPDGWLTRGTWRPTQVHGGSKP